jgi:hypothetical protein
MEAWGPLSTDRSRPLSHQLRYSAMANTVRSGYVRWFINAKHSNSTGHRSLFSYTLIKRKRDSLFIWFLSHSQCKYVTCRAVCAGLSMYWGKHFYNVNSHEKLNMDSQMEKEMSPTQVFIKNHRRSTDDTQSCLIISPRFVAIRLRWAAMVLHDIAAVQEDVQVSEPRDFAQ